MSIAREAGDRAKVAVRSNNENVDPVGTCVGPRGERIQTIVNELKGENMDIVQWQEDPADFISNALNPADVLEVRFDPENEHVCTVVVPDDQLSLAIGKRGQNVRLAARLTGYKIDIKSESDMQASDDQEVAGEPESQDAVETDSTEENQVIDANDEELDSDLSESAEEEIDPSSEN